MADSPDAHSRSAKRRKLVQRSELTQEELEYRHRDVDMEVEQPTQQIKREAQLAAQQATKAQAAKAHAAQEEAAREEAAKEQAAREQASQEQAAQEQAAQEQAARVQAALQAEQQAVEDAARAAAQRAAELANRKAYLNTLPAVLASALTPEGRLVATREDLPEDERRWKKTLDDHLPLAVFSRGEIEASCAASLAEDLYITNLDAAMFLRHDNLSRTFHDAKFKCLPGTTDQLAYIERWNPIAQDLALTHHWEKAPLSVLTAQSDVAYRLRENGRFNILPTSIILSAREKLLRLEEFHFVNLQAFIRETAMLPWLKDLAIRTEPDVRLSSAAVTWKKKAPMFMNGVMVKEDLEF